MKKKTQPKPKPKGGKKYRIAELLCVTLILIGCMDLAGCASTNPKTDEQASQIVAEETPERRSEYVALIEAKEAAEAAGDPEAIEAAEAALKAFEDRRAAERAAEGGDFIGGLLGTQVPVIGVPLGKALGAFAAATAAPAVLTERGRKLLRKAARQASPVSHADAPGRVAILDALGTLMRAGGWGHSTDGSKKAAEKELAVPEKEPV